MKYVVTEANGTVFATYELKDGQVIVDDPRGVVRPEKEEARTWLDATLEDHRRAGRLVTETE